MSAYAYIAYTEREATLPAKYFVTLHHHTFNTAALRNAWLEQIVASPLLETLGLRAEAYDTEPVYLNTAEDTDPDAAANHQPFVISTPPMENGCSFLILQAADELASLRLVVPDWDTTMSKAVGKAYCDMFQEHYAAFAPLQTETLQQFKAA